MNPTIKRLLEKTLIESRIPEALPYFKSICVKDVQFPFDAALNSSYHLTVQQ